ncbi:hypothetical protein [Streptomyces noursei]|uniref:hypothetical protein n=1 Tax=Streptomyces noursei TaxID=1971 RepID=UPI00381A31B4
MNQMTPRELKPTIRRVRSGFCLQCPLCGELEGSFRFEPMARRAFGEHCDEKHGAPSPLEAALVLVPLARAGAGEWTHEAAAGTYRVRQVDEGFAVEPPGGGLLQGLGTLPEAQICIARAVGVITPAQAEAARLGVRSLPRARHEVVSVLLGRLQAAKELAGAKGMPHDAPWSVSVGQPEVNEFGGAEKVRSAARAAAQQLGIRIHTYAMGRDDRSPDQLVVLGNRGAPFRPRPLPRADPRWPAFAPTRDPDPAAECDCGGEPCSSAGLGVAADEGWLVADWFSLTPITDLRTLPADLRSFDPRALFAKTRACHFDDPVIDLAPYQQGVPLGPLSDVQVYATNPHGYYKGLSHGVGCSWAQEVGEQHEILTLAEFLPLLPVVEAPSSRGYGSGADIYRELMYKDRSAERWCTSCAGYAIRRFTPSQCAYYRQHQASPEV